MAEALIFLGGCIVAGVISGHFKFKQWERTEGERIKEAVERMIREAEDG